MRIIHDSNLLTLLKPNVLFENQCIFFHTGPRTTFVRNMLSLRVPSNILLFLLQLPLWYDLWFIFEGRNEGPVEVQILLSFGGWLSHGQSYHISYFYK